MSSFFWWVELHSHLAKGMDTRMDREVGAFLQLTDHSIALSKPPALPGPALLSPKGGGRMRYPLQLCHPEDRPHLSPTGPRWMLAGNSEKGFASVPPLLAPGSDCPGIPGLCYQGSIALHLP